MNFQYWFPIPVLTDFIVLGVLLVFILILWFQVIFHFNLVKKKIKKELQHEEVQVLFTKGISIIIAARNAKSLLMELIPKLLEQQYAKFEIVVADDGSWDETGAWFIPLTEQNNQLKYVFLDPQYLKMSGKKFALTMAIKKAQYDYFLFLDADCEPAGIYWLQRMANGFSEMEKQIVIGYSPFYKRPGLLQKLMRFENVYTGLLYLSAAIRNKPYMGVGRNLAYSREVYNSVGGFSSHAHILAGDDDLFVQEAANNQNATVEIHPDSFVYTESKPDFKSYWAQKKRHHFVGKYYQSVVKRRLTFFPLIELFFWITFIISLFVSGSYVYPILLFILRFVVEWPVFYACAKKLEQPHAVGVYPYMLVQYHVFTLWNGLRAYFSKKQVW